MKNQNKKKKCTACKKNLSLDKFTRNKIMSDGLSIYCTKCKNQKAKEYRLANFEAYRKREKESRFRRINEIAAYQEEYYSRPEVIKKTKAYLKKYQKKNREKLNAYQREYYKKNCERLKEKSRLRMQEKRKSK